MIGVAIYGRDEKVDIGAFDIYITLYLCMLIDDRWRSSSFGLVLLVSTN